MDNSVGYNMDALFKKETLKFFLFLIPCIVLLPITYHLMFLEELPYLLFGEVSIFLPTTRLDTNPV